MSEPSIVARSVEKTNGLHGETEASYAASAVARVLRRYVSDGEIEEVLKRSRRRSARSSPDPNSISKEGGEQDD